MRIWRDIRYALRVLRRTPGFTAAAVLSLALGIGANTAIFSLIDTLMLRMLPVRHPEQLVEILHRTPLQGEPRLNGYSVSDYQFFREHNHVFSALIAASNPYPPLHAREGAGRRTVAAEFVGGNFFPELGVKPATGRLIGPADDGPGTDSARVAVVSWAWWKSRFNLDPAIAGKQIVVEDAPLTIIGVAPREFVGLRIGYPQDVWLPLAAGPLMRGSNSPNAPNSQGVWLVGRLKPGVSIVQARAEMTMLFRQTMADRLRTADNPLLRGMEFYVEPAGAGLSRLRDLYAQPLVLLMAVVALLLLIACANVANMLLARGAARQREMAVRLALGASGSRLAGEVLTESLLLSIAGSLLGVVLAYLCTAILVRIIGSARDPIELHVTPDMRVLLFTAAVALVTGALFGLAPAWRALGTSPAGALRESGRGSQSRFRRLFGNSLVAVQVALSIVVLTAAGLAIGHLSDLRGPKIGLRRDHVLLVTVDPPRDQSGRERMVRAYGQTLARLAAIPGVKSATVIGVTPIAGVGAGRAITVEGYLPKQGESRRIGLNWIAPRYFETLGTPLVAGRDFNAQDETGPRVALVNQTMAGYYFGDASPLGRHVRFDGQEQEYEIVGLAADAKYSDPHEPMVRTMYLDAFQDWIWPSNFALRTSVDPASVAPDVRRAVNASLNGVPIVRIKTLADQIDASIVPERLTATLAELFGALGAVLAAIGLYGLLAYTVARRVNEIGIRMALGATRSRVIRMVLAEALAMMLAGLAVGAPLAMWGSRWAVGFIPDLPANRATPIVLAAAGMIVVGLVAAYIPARRASRVQPMEALRYE
jgi:putative ABC transport system permease protein